ncbi:MAG: exodeoxyribonuclease VII large subunit [Microthrixaceae bacterium]
MSRPDSTVASLWDDSDMSYESEPIGTEPTVHTWSVTEIHDVVDGLLKDAFGDEIWVEGEIRNLNRSKNGHVYFDLVDAERADENYPPILSITLFDRVRQSVNRFLKENGGGVRVSDGVRVRIRGQLRTYASRSSLQLRMTGIDPQFTLGVLEQMRQKVLAALQADGLIERNSQTHLSIAPMRLALVTSVGSAAHADALHELERAGLGFEVLVFDARVQGVHAGPSIAAALRSADSHRVDVVLLVRGGGAKTDLAAFDLEEAARAIAAMSVPVFTGIGHEVDSSIADLVAHSDFKTPTAAAAAVCEQTRAALDGLDVTWDRIQGRCLGVLVDSSAATASLATRVERSAKRHLNDKASTVQYLTHGLHLSASSRLSAVSMLLDEHNRRCRSASANSLELAGYRLDALSARAKAHDPKLALARGWSIIRDSLGNLVRSTAEVSPGQILRVTIADGTITSVVESTTPYAPDAPQTQN